MRTRIYAKPERGQAVDLTKPGMQAMLRLLVPSIAIAAQTYEDIVFYIVEAGEAVTVTRHEDGCMDALASAVHDCHSCEGMEITFHTDIWIVAEVIIELTREAKGGKKVRVPEPRFYSSRYKRIGTLSSPLNAEMLQLSYEDTEVVHDEAETSEKDS